MRYSDAALLLLAAQECGVINTKAQFWANFSDRAKFDKEIANNNIVIEMSKKLFNELDVSNGEEKIVCAFDKNFPIINHSVKNNGEKPYLLFYKGNLELLQNLNKNVAVIGLIDPDEKIIYRETDVVKRLVKNELVIVSGLAIGCDTIAHKTCLGMNGKTIAILPSQLGKIYPSENRDIAEEIVNNDGLLVTEYYKDSKSKYEAINRFIERDRLQAMFAKAIILIASYKKGEGDSGSRHAMEAAWKYGIDRYVLYKNSIDVDDRRFGLNKDLIDSNRRDHAKILVQKSIDLITSLENPSLSNKANYCISEQLKLI